MWIICVRIFSGVCFFVNLWDEQDGSVMTSVICDH